MKMLNSKLTLPHLFPRLRIKSSHSSNLLISILIHVTNSLKIEESFLMRIWRWNIIMMNIALRLILSKKKFKPSIPLTVTKDQRSVFWSNKSRIIFKKALNKKQISRLLKKAIKNKLPGSNNLKLWIRKCKIK